MTHPIPRIAPAADDAYDVATSMTDQNAIDLSTALRRAVELSQEWGDEAVVRVGRWTVRFRRRDGGER